MSITSRTRARSFPTLLVVLPAATRPWYLRLDGVRVTNITRCLFDAKASGLVTLLFGYIPEWFRRPTDEYGDLGLAVLIAEAENGYEPVAVVGSIQEAKTLGRRRPVAAVQ